MAATIGLEATGNRDRARLLASLQVSFPFRVFAARDADEPD